MIGRQNLRPLRVDPAVAHPHFIHLIHQFADEIKAKTGVAEGRDLALAARGSPRCSRSRIGNYLRSTSGASLTQNQAPQQRSVTSPPAAARPAFTRAPARNRIGREDRERDPDEPEGHHLRAAGTARDKQKSPRKKVQLGARYWRKPSVVRRRCRAACANQSSGTPVTIPVLDQQQRQARACRARNAARPCRQINQATKRERHDHRRLQKQPRDRRRARDFAEQPIEPEGKTKSRARPTAGAQNRKSDTVPRPPRAGPRRAARASGVRAERARRRGR